LLIGRTANGTLTLSEDDRGLLATIIPPDTSVGRDVVELVANRYLSQMSFAFRLWDHKKGQKWEELDEYTLRTVLEARLADISIVAFPAYEKTSVDVAARSLEEWRAENAKLTAMQHDELANKAALEGQRAAMALTRAKFGV
jgi:HK97 family phage prohead protease